MASAKVAAVRVPVLGTYFRGSRSAYRPYRSGGRSFAYAKHGRRHGRASHRRHRRGRR